LKIEKENLEETCEVKLTVEVDADQIEAAKRIAARKIAQKHNVPGFRKGKAPYEIVLRTFGDGAILEEALDELGQKVYEQALRESEIDPVAPGAFVDFKKDPITFIYNVSLRPVIDLGEYLNVRLGFTEPEITDQALEDTLERLRETQTILEPVERPAQLSDVVTVDVSGVAKPAAIEGEVVADSQPEASTQTQPESSEEKTDSESAEKTDDEFLMDDKGVDVLLDAKLNWPVPGFADKLVGIVVDEERHVEIPFPDDYENESLRGQIGHFDLKCTSIKSRTLPEWDDELAKSLGDYESLADMRTKVRQALVDVANKRHLDEYSKSVIDIMVAGSKVKFPPVLLSNEVHDMMRDLDMRLREQRMTLDDYMRMTDTTHDKMHEELEPRARERLRRSLVLGQIIEAEKIEVTDEAINDRIEVMLISLGESPDKKIKELIKSENMRRSVRYDLLTEKAVQRAVEFANGYAASAPESELRDSTPSAAESAVSETSEVS
jgi:trigger factor